MAVLRWLVAQRVWFTPLWVVLGLAVAGLVGRFTLTVPPWEQAGLLLLAALPPLIYAARVAKWWVRWWNTLLTLACAGWVGAFWVLDDPASLWQALLALGLVMFVMRLCNTDLRVKVSVEGEFRDWPEVAKRIGYPDIRWVQHRAIPGQGWTARLSWPGGAYDRNQVIKDVAKFEGARDLPVGSLRLLPHGRSRNAVDAIYVADDPNTAAIEWPGPEKAAGLSVLDRTPLGRHSDESVASIQRYTEKGGARRVLVGGSSESGKSGIIHQLVGEDAMRDDAVQLGMDLKGGIELGLWEQVLLWMVSDIDGAMEMLAALEAGATYRLSYMRARRIRVWPVSPELPAVHITVDEIRKLAGSTSGRTGRQQRQVLDRLIDVATQGRAVGFGLLAAGQHLTLEALGTSQVRTQFDVRIGLRMNEKDGAAYVFPDDPQIRLHEIPRDQPGTGYVKDGDWLDPQPWRGYYWSDELVTQIAEARAGGGADLDQGTGDAMAAASPMFAEIWAAMGRTAPAEDTVAAVVTAAQEAAQQMTAPDVSLAEVTRRHRERTGVVPPTPLRPREPERLSQVEAEQAVRQALAEAGPDGVTPRELYRAATRSSSWLHPLISKWVDEGAVVRTAAGRYAAARTSAGIR